MIENLKFDEKGLIPAVVQDQSSREVLMVAYMNEESLKLTQETGYTHFYSRSRKALWKKGETSGNVQKVKEIRVDCDNDTLLVLVEPAGPACHTNHYSCFYTDFMSGKEIPFTSQNRNVLYDVYETIKNRVKYPVEGSYTNYLFEKGIDKMLKKVGEETTEVVIAAKNRVYGEVRYEVADLMYHLSVVLAEQNMTWDDIFDELRSREK